MDKISLTQESEALKDFYRLKNLGNINNHTINLIKISGEYEWHTHEDEDKLFLVIDGVLELHFRDKVIELHKDDFIIIPKGTENKPIGREVATLLLFEPKRN